jgi:hypothetical protein
MRNTADQFSFHRAAFYSQLKSKVGNVLAKVTALSINLNIDATTAHTLTPPTHKDGGARDYASTSTRAHSPLPLTNLSPPIHFPFRETDEKLADALNTDRDREPMGLPSLAILKLRRVQPKIFGKRGILVFQTSPTVLNPLKLP